MSATALSLDTFATTQQLLLSLLRYWPHAPHTACASLLLYGPSGSGKSHLLNDVLQCVTPQYDAEGAAPEADMAVVMARPALAQALTTRHRDGTTGLRVIVRDAVVRACVTKNSYASNGNNGKTTMTCIDDNTGSSEMECAALVVLDHLEFFVSVESGGGAAADARGPSGGATQLGLGTGAAVGGGGGGGDADNRATMAPARHATFVADLYTMLTSSPPLFTQREAAALGLRRLVFVSVLTGDAEDVHPLLREHAFTQTVALPTPGQAARQRFFDSVVATTSAAIHRDNSIGIQELARALALRTGGISYHGLTEISHLLLDELSADSNSSTDRHIHDRSLQATSTGAITTDAAAAWAHELVTRFQSSGSVAAFEHRSSAGYVDVQATRWDDIAGMEEAKAALRLAVARPLKHRAQYLAAGVRPSTGILLHGPPGTGKTMLAKAAATALNAAFVYVDLSALVQAEVGESERRLKGFFDVARERSPTVMFVDELQAAFGVRYTEQGTKSQAASASAAAPPSAHDARLVSHLLRLLDEAHADDEHLILFMGATNVAALLDPLLLRAGRLDTQVEVGLPTAAARVSLAQRVVTGDWATWWTREESVSSSLRKHSGSETAASAASSVQAALIDAFVSRAEGLSGAEMRHATSVFALRLMQEVARMSVTDSTGTSDDVSDGGDTGGCVGGRFSIGSLLAGWSDSLLRLLKRPEEEAEAERKGCLSDTALRLLQEAFPRTTTIGG